MASLPQSPVSSPTPDVLTSNFRSLFVVGRGGMGSVEVALETAEDGTERVVALKRMLPNSSFDKRQTEMFLREAKLASLLVHPNVVHATSFGESGGELYLVMEYIEGEPLSRVVAAAHEKEGKLALSLVATVLARICEGLHAAHELKDDAGRPLNVIHRDISPQNVMIAYDGSVKLLDFGVAKIDALDVDGRTKTGEVKGKTSYMSPEQAMGEPIDRRSDLYSIGAVLFEAVSGRKMWGGGTELDVLRRLALEEPPSLSDVAPHAPPGLCALQKRLVARDPAKRPATALEVARELEAYAESVQGDVAAIRAVMQRLFGAEIERRRAALTKALAETSPCPTPDLRPSAAPAPGDDTPAPATTHENAARPSGRWTTRLAVVGAFATTVAIAGGIFMRRSERSPGASPETASSAAAPSRPAKSEPTSTGEQPTAASPTDAPPRSARTPPPSDPVPAAPSAVPVPPERPRPKVKPAVTSTKPNAPLDVDPTPF